MRNENKMALGIVPRYAILPLLLTLAANMLSYYGSRIIADDFYHHKVSIFLDDIIPCVPQWIIIYFGCYISWVAFYIIICRENKKVCFDFVTAEICAKLISMLIFIIYPTQMFDRIVPDESFWGNAMSFLYASDAPVNLFPSIHCFASWIAFRGLTWCQKIPKWLEAFAFVIAILVFLSTLFTKQHYFVDIIGGIAVAELGIFISKKLRLSKFVYEKVWRERY